MACCSPCDQRRATAHLRIDLDTNAVSWGETTIHLGPRDAELLKVLHDAAPRTVTPRQVEARVLGHGDEDRCGGWLRVRVCLLRRRLRGLPVEIVTDHGCGYRLMDAHQPLERGEA